MTDDKPKQEESKLMRLVCLEPSEAKQTAWTLLCNGYVVYMTATYQKPYNLAIGNQSGKSEIFDITLHYSERDEND